MCSHYLGEIGSVSVEEDSCSLVLVMEEGGPMRFHVETSRTAWDIKNVIQRGKDGGELQVYLLQWLSPVSLIQRVLERRRCPD